MFAAQTVNKEARIETLIKECKTNTSKKKPNKSPRAEEKLLDIKLSRRYLFFSYFDGAKEGLRPH